MNRRWGTVSTWEKSRSTASPGSAALELTVMLLLNEVMLLRTSREDGSI